MKSIRTGILRAVVHAGALIPLALLVLDFFTARLTANPIQAATQRTGRAAVLLLILSLACTPLNTLSRTVLFTPLRRTLGLYAFFYAGLHLLIYVGIDYSFNGSLILPSIIEKPFIMIGFLTFFILSLLALTSSQQSMAILKKNWKRLHRLVYPAALLAILHFVWARKGSFFPIKGDILQPFIYAVVVLLLLVARLLPVRRWLGGFSFVRDRKSPEDFRTHES